MARAIAARPAPDQRSRLMLIAALIFAAIAAVLVFVTLQSNSDGGQSTSSSAAATVSVVVAARDIGANTTLTADMLALRDVAADGAISGVFPAVESLVGTPTRFPIQAGEQVTSFKIGASAVADKEDIALTLAPGMRAVAVQVSEVTGVGGLLLPRNFVDVIAVFPNAPAGVGGDALQNVKSVTLLQNIEVLAVGQEAQEPVPVASEDGQDAARGQRPGDAGRQPDAKSATLAVTPQDAQLLALVQEAGGIIWLSLRPAGDQDTPSPAESNLLRFFPLPPAPEPGF